MARKTLSETFASVLGRRRHARRCAPPAIPHAGRLAPHLVALVEDSPDPAHAEFSMRHHAALFDRIIIVDTGSAPSIVEESVSFKSSNGIEIIILRLEKGGPVVSTEIVQALIFEGVADWLFLLQGSDIFPFCERDSLVQSLCQHATKPLIRLPRLDVVPQEGQIGKMDGSRVLCAERPSGDAALAINLRVQDAREMTLPLPTAKATNSSASGLFRLHHSEHAPSCLSGPMRGLTLTVAVETVARLRRGKTEVIESSHDRLRTDLSARFPLERQQRMTIALDGAGARFEGLRSRASLNQDRPSGLPFSAATAAQQAVAIAVNSAWYGHVPFLFALMQVMRPRRFVELGTHNGASFFAACQHIRDNGRYGEAVAIDLWEGDAQAGFYGDSVFQSFKRLLEENFPREGRYIRSLFSEAAQQFDAGSIDLLHVDGLHTYEAASEDFMIWRPKLAAQSVVLFHDTSEFEAGFGVWQVFDEVQSEASASFRFWHGHGLGILAFGDRDQNPAIPFLELLKQDPLRSELFFSELGQVMRESAGVS